jgi:hypothetical protein
MSKKTATMTRSIPLDRECSVCQAKVGEPCTQPTDRGRKAVTWFHLDREFGIQTSEGSQPRTPAQ